MFFSSAKEISRLIRKEMSNIYLKVTVEKKFSKLKKFVSRAVFGELETQTEIIEFSNFLMQLKNQSSKSESEKSEFYYFNCERRSRFLLSKKINFNEKEAESKMETPYTLLEWWTFCLSSYKNQRLKVKLWWNGARKRKKIAFFFYFMHSCCLLLESRKPSMYF